jgi:hypothetical protein
MSNLKAFFYMRRGGCCRVGARIHAECDVVDVTSKELCWSRCRGEVTVGGWNLAWKRKGDLSGNCADTWPASTNGAFKLKRNIGSTCWRDQWWLSLNCFIACVISCFLAVVLEDLCVMQCYSRGQRMDSDIQQITFLGSIVVGLSFFLFPANVPDQKWSP